MVTACDTTIEMLVHAWESNLHMVNVAATTVLIMIKNQEYFSYEKYLWFFTTNWTHANIRLTKLTECAAYQGILFGIVTRLRRPLSLARFFYL